MMNKEYGSLKELMEEARLELDATRAEEDAERQIATQKRREEFTRAWAATFEACAKLLPGPLQPFLRGFPEFKAEEIWNDLPSLWVHFELQVKGLAPITVSFMKIFLAVPPEQNLAFKEGDLPSEPSQAKKEAWQLDLASSFRVPIYEKSVDYVGEPEVAVCRATDNFGPDSLLLALARAEESEQERLRLEAEVEQQKAERRARQAEREAQSDQYQHEDPLVARARRFQAALREFMEVVEE